MPRTEKEVLRSITKSRRPTGEGDGGKGDSALLVRKKGWEGAGQLRRLDMKRTHLPSVTYSHPKR